VDLGGVKEAPARELARGAAAAARNARGLVDDAELLSGAGRLARAYSLSGLAIEEVGKADSLAALAAMPENLRARATRHQTSRLDSVSVRLCCRRGHRALTPSRTAQRGRST